MDKECGFVYDGNVYDTMVAEYLLARSQSRPLGLASQREKYNVTKKRKTSLYRTLRRGTRSTTSPWDIVREYGIADVMATEEIALAQLEKLGTTFEEIYSEPRTDS